MMNKRGLLLGAASAVAAPQVLATAAPAPGARGALAADGLPLLAGSPGLTAWQPYLGQVFELTDGVQTWAVALGSADALRESETPARTEQFVLGFGMQGGARVAAGVHSVRHANGQSTLLYPADAGCGPAQSLRAEFNLLLQPV